MDLGPIKIIDRWLGSLACLILGLLNIPFRWKGQIKEAKSILIIQLWGVGETITTLPAIKAFRKRYRNARIDVLATSRNGDVFFGNQDIDKVIELEMGMLSVLSFIMQNWKKYDLVVDMEEYLNVSALISFFTGHERIGFDHGFRALLYTKKTIYNDRQHSVFTFMNLAQIVDADAKADKLVPLKYEKKDDMETSAFLRKNRLAKGDFIIGIAPGAAESAGSRKWMKERFAKFADTLLDNYSKKKCRIIFIGSSDERALVDEIMVMMTHEKNVYNAAGIFTLKQTFALIKKCRAFVGNDSGPMHIAAAQGVRTLGLFGPNTPARWAPFGKGNAYIYHRESCIHSPCINTHRGQVPDCLYSKNSTDYQKCMKAITVDNALLAFSKIAKR